MDTDSEEPTVIPDSQFQLFEEDETKVSQEEKVDLEANIYSQACTTSQQQELITEDVGEANKDCDLPMWNQIENADEIRSQELPEEEDDNFDVNQYMSTAADLVEEYATFGCAEIDKFLKGGFPTHGITELYGESGSGKTQICLQLSLTCQLPIEDGGLNSSVLYICTEKEFPSIRLKELTVHFKSKYGDKLPENPMDFVFVEHIDSEEELEKCLDVRLDALARKQSSNQLRLVVLDSIAGIFRLYDSKKNDWEERANKLRQVAQTLANFSYLHKAVILVCNQVTTDCQTNRNVASLGMAWRNCTNTRIRLQKYVGQRTMRVTESSYIPVSTISFIITSEGIRAA